MSAATLRNWEHGRNRPQSRRQAERLAQDLGATVEELGLAEPAPAGVELPSVASCYVVRDGRLLMTRRRFAEGTFEWAAISGKIEPGETADQAAVREAREEVGLSIEVTDRLGERVHPATGRHLIYVTARVLSGEPAIVDHEEITAMDWADWPTVQERWSTLKGGIFPPVREYLSRVLVAERAADPGASSAT